MNKARRYKNPCEINTSILSIYLFSHNLFGFSTGSNSIHANGSRCSLISKNFCFGEHIILIKGFLQIIHNLQSIVSIIICIGDKPTRSTQRTNKSRVLRVFQLKTVVIGIELKTPDLLALNNIHRNVAQHFIYMLKPLSTTVKTNVIMPTAHESIKEISIDIILERAAIHLHTQFIHADDSDSQSVVFIVVNFIGFANCTDLCQTREPFIRNAQINIRENQDTLCYKFLPPIAPDCKTVIPLIFPADNLLNEGERFTIAEITAENVQIASLAQIALLISDIVIAILDTIVNAVKRMRQCAANAGKQPKQKASGSDKNVNQRNHRPALIHSEIRRKQARTMPKATSTPNIQGISSAKVCGAPEMPKNASKSAK